MKKLAMFAAAAMLAATIQAQEAVEPSEDEVSIPETTENPPKETVPWPAFFAFCELPETPDLIGLRLTIPFSTKQESVTGIDLGFWGRARYFEGIQINLLRNDAIDQLSGFQIGLYNSTQQAHTFGIQAGLWNEAGILNGVQAGLVNTVGSMHGIQVGVINRADALYGFQVGAINVIRSGSVRFFPIVNVGF